MKKIILFSILVLSSCATTSKNSSYRDLHPEMYVDNHPQTEKLKFEEKNFKAPKNFLEEISRSSKAENTKDWLKFNPENYELNPDQLKFIQSEVKKVPEKLKLLANKNLLYWSFVSKLGASGLTISVYPENEKSSWKNVVLMNNDNLEMDFCDYLKIKEGSVYSKGKYKIGCTTNKRISKFLLIFMHELGHVISSNNYLVPHTTNIQSDNSVNWYLFSRLSWEWDKKNYVVPNDPKMAEWQTSRKYYSVNENEKRPNDLMVDDFKAWKKSSFVTLYSVFSPEEDWAEQMLIMSLKKYMGIEIKFSLSENGKVIDEISPCSENPVCDLKRKLMEFYIDNPSIFP